ncbi:MAG: hypothetical protein R3F65_12420 [bacterium]
MYEDELARRRWRSRQRNLLFAGRVDEVLRGVARALMRLPPGSAAREPLEDLHRYLSKRREQLDYGRLAARALHRQRCRRERDCVMLQQRMKLAGTRWLWPGARAMCALRCAWRTSGGFDALFEVAPAAGWSSALAS